MINLLLCVIARLLMQQEVLSTSFCFFSKTLQILTVLSNDPEMMNLSLLTRITQETASLCPVKKVSCCLFLRFQIHKVLSFDAEIKYFLSLLIANAVNAELWPFTTISCFLSKKFQILIVLSTEAETIYWLSLEKATENIQFL